MPSAAPAERVAPGSRVVIHDILFPSDLTPDSEHAFDHARLLAERFRAEVTLYHAVEVPDERYPTWTSESSHQLWSDAERAAREILARQAEPLTTRHFVTVERARSARDAVVEMIRGRRPDLTVMATHGRRGLGHLLASSVTEDVVEHVHCPLLGVRATRGLPYRRILVPTDFSLASRLAFPMAALLAQTFDAEVIGVHVTAVPTAAASPAGLPPGAPKVPSEATLWEFLRPDFDPLPVTALVHTGHVWDRIVHTAADEEVDLIVMATRGHDSLSDKILGSNTERVLRHAPCPVLVA